MTASRSTMNLCIKNVTADSKMTAGRSTMNLCVSSADLTLTFEIFPTSKKLADLSDLPDICQIWPIFSKFAKSRLTEV